MGLLMCFQRNSEHQHGYMHVYHNGLNKLLYHATFHFKTLTALTKLFYICLKVVFVLNISGIHENIIENSSYNYNQSKFLEYIQIYNTSLSYIAIRYSCLYTNNPAPCIHIYLPKIQIFLYKYYE
jgi:uncharacterized membrane protein